jgi:hypothetical protein
MHSVGEEYVLLKKIERHWVSKKPMKTHRSLEIAEEWKGGS